MLPRTASVKRCRRSPRRYNGIQNRPSGANNLHVSSLCVCLFPMRETLKHRRGPSGLDLFFVCVIRCFAFSNLSGTAATKYNLSNVCRCAKYIENTERIGPSKSSGRQNGTPNRPSASKWCSFIKDGRPKTCSFKRIDF